MHKLKYLAGYSETIQQHVQHLIKQGKLADVLLQKYDVAHDIKTDKALYTYVTELKSTYLGHAQAINKVLFDNKMHVVQHTLGTHTSISRIQGSKLKSKHEIRVSSLFKEVPIEFLRMISVHELAHLKEKDHNKAFYKLCLYMEPNYHQHELDLRLYLTYLDAFGKFDWPNKS